MQYSVFENIGIKVSRFGLGCMRLPTKTEDGKEIMDKFKAIEMIRYAADNGVNYFDTAHMYHDGESKYLLGEALEGGYRERVFIASKIPSYLINQYADFDNVWNEHLEALRTNCIDFCLLHALNSNSWNKLKNLGALEYLDEAKAKGKIKYPGFSFHGDIETFKEILNSYNWDMCQIQLNILDTDIQAGLEGLRYAAQRGIPVVIMEPLKGGKLSVDIPSEIMDIYNSYKVKRSPQEWAFRWLGSLSEVKLILSGSSTLEQLKDTISIFSAPDFGKMSSEEYKLVQSVKEAYNSRTKVGCTACKYCIPCPSDVAIPSIFKAYNNAYMYNRFNEEKEKYKELLRDSKGANKCIECGNCESVCPQNIKIIDTLKVIHKEFTE